MVQTIFGSNFFYYDSDKQRLIRSNNFGMFFVIAAPLTLLPVTLWLGWEYFSRKSRSKGKYVEKAKPNSKGHSPIISLA
jgi:hypothetical protein